MHRQSTRDPPALPLQGASAVAMSAHAETEANFVGHYSTTQRIDGDLHNDEQRLRRQTLKGRRTWVICLKIFANMLFLFAWSYVSINDNAYQAPDTLLGKSFWVDFSVYIGISACLPLFCIIGLLREGIIVSHVWFEMAWLLFVSAFDGYLIWRQTRFWTWFRSYGKIYFDDPYLTISTVSYVLAIVGLVIDLGLSLFWSGFLGNTAWRNRRKYRTIWVSNVQNFPWLLPAGLSDRFPGPVRFIFGAPRETSPAKSIPAGLKRWFLGSTMFRKSGPLEPFSHSLLRGTVALAAWLSIIAYAIFNCVINPLQQFTQARGLPSRSLLQDSHVMKTYGNITGFIVLDVVPISQFPSDTGDWEYPQETRDAILGGIGASVRDPSTDEVIGNCMGGPSGTEINWKDGGFTDLQIEVHWDCGPIWDEIKFRTSASVPNSRPYVSISWNSTAYQTRSVLNAGLGGIHFNRPNITDFEPVITGRNVNPHEVEPGVTFNLTAGQNLHINVGRRRDYNVRATFLDLIGGFSQIPSVYVTYPILDVTDNSATIDPQITTFNFYPMFTAYNDDLYEQYLDHTVLTGLTKIGGLYSSFEVVFVLFFGRSLLAALFGKNNTNPFGRIADTIEGDKFRKRLQEAYPGIDGEDPKQRVEATCAFLHDFILDLKPLKIKPTYMTRRRPNSSGTEDVDAGSDVTGGEKDIEAAHGALHDRDAAKGSEKV